MQKMFLYHIMSHTRWIFWLISLLVSLLHCVHNLGIMMKIYSTRWKSSIMKSYRKEGGNGEECNIMNQNLEGPRKHFHSWKCKFRCSFLEQCLSPGMVFRTVVAFPGHTLHTVSASVLLLLIVLGFLLKHVINLRYSEI